MEVLQNILSFVEGHLLEAVGIVSTVLEIVFRLIPTKKPLSILLIASKALKLISKIFDGIAQFLDKVIPQNLLEKKEN